MDVQRSFVNTRNLSVVLNDAMRYEAVRPISKLHKIQSMSCRTPQDCTHEYRVMWSRFSCPGEHVVSLICRSTGSAFAFHLLIFLLRPNLDCLSLQFSQYGLLDVSSESPHFPTLRSAHLASTADSTTWLARFLNTTSLFHFGQALF
jgi:hypothetical protein